VVYDRYIYDAAVPPAKRLDTLHRAARWVEGQSCPAPDIVVLLDAPGAVMHARKGEYSPEELEVWRRAFLSLRDRIPRLETVDATRAADYVRTDVINRIWRRYAARWGDR